MAEWEISGFDSDAPAAVLGRSAEELQMLISDFGFDVLRAMRSVWTQHGNFDDIGALAADRGLDRSVPTEITEVLLQVPHGFDPLLTDVAAMRQSLATTPNLGRLITQWAAIFGGYNPTGKVITGVVVYTPIFDYGADPAIENALTVAVDYDHETTKSAKATMSFKGIGLVGTRSTTISTKLKVPDTSGTFQVAVPVELDLTEYVGPMASDIRFTAKVVNVGAATHEPEGSSNYNPVTPRTRALVPVDFLGPTALGVSVSDNITKSTGFEATAEKTLSSGLKLNLEYKVSAKAVIGVTYTKKRADKLKRKLWKDAHGIARIEKG